MAKVITLSRTFPKGHIRESQPTHFVEKVWSLLCETMGYSSPAWFFDELPGLQQKIDLGYWITAESKHHTIRASNRWKDGDVASLRIWSGKPYNSPQITIAPDLKVRVKQVDMDENGIWSVNGKYLDSQEVYEIMAKNDGLTDADMQSWFLPNYDKPKAFSGQMIIWSNIELPY